MKTMSRNVFLIAAIALMCAGAAHAFQFQASDSIKGSLDTQFTLGAGMRLVNQNPHLIGDPRVNGGANTGFSSNGDDGNLNYNKNDFFTTYLKVTPELLLKFPDRFQVHGAGDGAVRLQGDGYPADGPRGRRETAGRAGLPAAGPLGQQGPEHRLPAGPHPGGEPGHQLGGEHLRDRRDQLHQLAGLPEALDPGDAAERGGPSRPDRQRRVGGGRRRQRRGVLPVPLEREPPASRGHLFFRGGHPGEGPAAAVS